MLIYLPFIFFSILALYFWNKQKSIDVSVFLFAEYALTSFLSILCVKMGLVGGGGIHFTPETLNLNIFPTFLYCTTITIIILQFTNLNIDRFGTIHLPNQHLFTLFCLFLIIISLLNIYVVLEDIFHVIQHGDFESVRIDHYNQEDTLSDIKRKSLPLVLGYLYYFNRSTLLALPCFFYSICFLQKHWLFNVSLLITALSMPLAGIANADRTEFIFFSQTLILSILLFRPFIHKKQKKFLIKLIAPITILFIMYLGAVTISRFEHRESGSSGGTLQYAGQSYLNFCYFYENANTQMIYTHRMFPLINHILKDEDYIKDIKNKQSSEQGFFVGVFPSFIGDFLLDTGLIGMLLWVTMFILISKITLNFKKNKTITFGNIMWYYVLSTIPMFGIFYYPYYDYMQGIYLWLSAIISILFHFRFKIMHTS